MQTKPMVALTCQKNKLSQNIEVVAIVIESGRSRCCQDDIYS